MNSRLARHRLPLASWLFLLGVWLGVPNTRAAAAPNGSAAGEFTRAEPLSRVSSVSPRRDRPVTIVYPASASFCEELAAHELRRYIYLRTGELLPLKAASSLPSGSDLLVVSRAGSALVAATARAAGFGELGAQEFALKSGSGPGAAQASPHRVLLVLGGDDSGVLYGAYRLAEHLGVRFYIDGDVLPDEPTTLKLSGFDERAKPLFALRGLLPFHDFPEGPDWWTLDDWKSVLTQAAKMRMNFVGLHTYPNSNLGPEPTVWVGLPQDCNPDGTVKLSEPTSWHNTQRYTAYGLYRPEKTSAFSFGGDQIFETDNFGPEVNGPDDFPVPKTPAASVALMNRTGVMLRQAFSFAHELGIKTCVGTEGPLNVPPVVSNRLAALGLSPTNSATIQQLYAGMFQRIQRTYPLDYYWIWGHEGKIEPGRFITDLRCAWYAAESVRPSFRLGICGWGYILENLPALDEALPKDVIFSAISLYGGESPVSPKFAKLAGRERWAIPWFENDGPLLSPQLFVGRMRKDATDALAYGCSGLMGLHWRTRVLGPNISALAQAAWNQDGWASSGGARLPPSPDPRASSTQPRKDQGSAGASLHRPAERFLPTFDFYTDWAKAQFGAEVAEAIAHIFERLDGHFPRACDWNQGPGVISVNPRPWVQVETQYGFVEALANLRSEVKGAGNLDRFDWWLNMFRYAKAMAHLGCARGELDQVMKAVANESEPQARAQLVREQALPLRCQLVPLLGEMYGYLLATLNNSSEMGMLVNVEQQALLRTRLLTAHDDTLCALLGEPLPADAQPPHAYSGPDRIILPTRRTSLMADEPLTLKVIVLAADRPREAGFYWRPLGQGRFSKIPLQHINRGVYRVTLPPSRAKQDFEYYIQTINPQGHITLFPATAPRLNQTVVVSHRQPALAPQ